MTELISLVRADVARWRRIYGTYLYVIHPGCIAVLLYRLAHALVDKGPVGQLLARAITLFSILLTGADLHARAEIGPGLFIPHAQAVMFGEHTRAGANLTLYGLVMLGQGATGGFPQIGDDVTFWTKASAFGGMTIGDGAQIGAHSLVMGDVPAHHNAVGSPAKVKPQRPAETSA